MFFIPQNSDVGLKHRHHYIVVQAYILHSLPHCIFKLIKLV